MAASMQVQQSLGIANRGPPQLLPAPSFCVLAPPHPQVARHCGRRQLPPPPQPLRRLVLRGMLGPLAVKLHRPSDTAARVSSFPLCVATLRLSRSGADLGGGFLVSGVEAGVIRIKYFLHDSSNASSSQNKTGIQKYSRNMSARILGEHQSSPMCFVHGHCFLLSGGRSEPLTHQGGWPFLAQGGTTWTPLLLSSRRCGRR